MRPFIACSIAACIAGLTHAAYAVEADSVRILAPPSASCPAAADVARELSSLLPRLSITAGDDVKPASSVATLSFPAEDAYRVDLGSESRTFVDGGRRCADRARTAAVFIAMALSPPELAPDVAPDFTPNIAPNVAPPPSTLPSILTEQASPSDIPTLAPRLDPFLRASLAVYGASLAGTAIGLGTWAGGMGRQQPPNVCTVPVTLSGAPFANGQCGGGNSNANALIQAGLVTTIVSAAIGIGVGIPLTIIGARRNAAKQRAGVRATLVPVASGTQLGMAAVGSW